MPDLVEALAEIDGDHRIRVMYAYPNRFPWRLTELLRDHPRVEPYLDIPLQHASTPVLRAMRRAGSGDQVRAILDRLKTEVPGITLRTPLLVGFPGEREEDVAELCELVREYELSRVGAFTYSHEDGTPGGELRDDVPALEKVARRDAVFAARDEVLAKVQRRLVGETIDVLIDENHATRRVGRTSMDAPEVDLLTVVEGGSADVGDRIQVVVEGLDQELNTLCREVAEQVAP